MSAWDLLTVLLTANRWQITGSSCARHVDKHRRVEDGWDGLPAVSLRSSTLGDRLDKDSQFLQTHVSSCAHPYDTDTQTITVWNTHTQTETGSKYQRNTELHLFKYDGINNRNITIFSFGVYFILRFVFPHSLKVTSTDLSYEVKIKSMTLIYLFNAYMSILQVLRCAGSSRHGWLLVPIHYLPNY